MKHYKLDLYTNTRFVSATGHEVTLHFSNGSSSKREAQHMATNTTSTLSIGIPFYQQTSLALTISSILSLGVSLNIATSETNYIKI